MGKGGVVRTVSGLTSAVSGLGSCRRNSSGTRLCSTSFRRGRRSPTRSPPRPRRTSIPSSPTAEARTESRVCTGGRDQDPAGRGRPEGCSLWECPGEPSGAWSGNVEGRGEGAGCPQRVQTAPQDVLSFAQGLPDGHSSGRFTPQGTSVGPHRALSQVLRLVHLRTPPPCGGIEVNPSINMPLCPTLNTAGDA